MLSLKGKGLLPLSTDNPYAAPNLLLSKRIEESPYVKGFIEYQGVPSALELQERWFSSPSLALFYPNERYNLLEMKDGWLIEGPIPLSSHEQMRLQDIHSSRADTPKLLAHGAASKLQDDEKIRRVESFDQPSHPRQPSYLTRDPSQLPPRTVSNDPIQETGSTEQLSRSLRSLITASTSPNAEVTPRGDIVHYVTNRSETMAIIALWYTGDRANTGKIVRINQLQEPDKLKIGDVVVIPGYLVNNSKSLSAESVKLLEDLTPLPPVRPNLPNLDLGREN